MPSWMLVSHAYVGWITFRRSCLNEEDIVIERKDKMLSHPRPVHQLGLIDLS
jgi:hypothetical protein